MADQPMTIDPNLWSESTEIVIGPVSAPPSPPPSVGDVVNGRPVFGVRKVKGETFISFDGSSWLSA